MIFTRVSALILSWEEIWHKINIIAILIYSLLIIENSLPWKLRYLCSICYCLCVNICSMSKKWVASIEILDFVFIILLMPETIFAQKQVQRDP